MVSIQVSPAESVSCVVAVSLRIASRPATGISGGAVNSGISLITPKTAAPSKTAVIKNASVILAIRLRRCAL